MYAENRVIQENSTIDVQVELLKYKRKGYIQNGSIRKNSNGKYICFVYKEFEGELKHGRTK